MAENYPPNHEIEEDPQEYSSSDEIEEDNSSDEIRRREYSSDVLEGENIPEVVIKKRKIVEEDNTEETLQVLLDIIKNGDQTEIPPARIIGLSHYGKCIYKQLTESDVNGGQCRLMLGKKEVKDKFLSRLQESENIPGVEGIDVLVYGPDGKVYEMKFKMWNKDTPVLANGWSKFVEAYRLEKYRNVLKIWMFKASDEDGKICFAIDSFRFDDITKPLSNRIFKDIFKS